MMKKILLLITILMHFDILISQTVISIERKNDVYYIPCTVNGLQLNFIFDTGASDVTISLTEALFMLKNGYLKDSDFIEKKQYRIANGDIQEGTKINLREIHIGDRLLKNVNATIIHTTNAPLLFGQSAIEKFGIFSIDYTKNVLVLGLSLDKNSIETPNEGINNFESYLESAKKYSQSKLFDSAVLSYEIYMKNAPEISAAVYFLYGKSAYFAKQYSKAELAFATVNEKKPNYPDAYLWRGNSIVAMDPDFKSDFPKWYYEKYIEILSIDPQNFEQKLKYSNRFGLINAYEYLGFYYLNKKMEIKAKYYYLKVFELDPKNEKAITALDYLN
jgi:clan AA aspartic protease (TIGR02281 family)